MGISNIDSGRLWLLCQDLMLEAELDGTILATNPSWATVLGWSEAELRGSRFLGFVHPDDLQKAVYDTAPLADGMTVIQLDGRWRHKDGSYRSLSWNIVPDGNRFYAIGRDVSSATAGAVSAGRSDDTRGRERQIEAMSRFGAVIAHDFNNVLQGISGLMELTRKLIKMNRFEEAERFIENAIASTKRAATLTDRIQAFSIRPSTELKPVQLNDAIGAMESRLRNLVAPSIDIRVVASPTLWMTLCDGEQFEQVLLHLVTNANDAMPAGGTLLVETSNESVCDNHSASGPDITPGQYVCVAVTDSGVGMHRETIQKVFDPLFTTKASDGLNAGFGLSAVYRFVRQSRGGVGISSEIGRGTAVKLYLLRYGAG